MLLELENYFDFINAKQTNLSWHSCVWRDLGEFATVSWWLPLSLGDEALWSFREQMHIEINTGEWSSSVHLHSALCKKKKKREVIDIHILALCGVQLWSIFMWQKQPKTKTSAWFILQRDLTRTLDSTCLRARSARRWTPWGIIISIHQHTSLCGRHLRHKD